jgi:hypothetical protein
MKPRQFAGLTLSGLLLAVACNKTGAPSKSILSGNGPHVGPTTSTRYGSRQDTAILYEVTYTPETTVLSNDAVAKHLRKMSDDGSTFSFDSSSDEARSLKPGSVLLLSGVALRRVTRVEPVADGIEVTTSPAAITDGIQNGRIKTKYAVDFGSIKTNPILAELGRSSFSFIPSVYADTVESSVLSGATTFDVTIGQYRYEAKFTPANDRVNIEMTISLGGADSVTDAGPNVPVGFLVINGKGYIKNFGSTVDMLIQDSQMTQFSFANSGLNGEMEFTWEASNSVAGPMNKIGSRSSEILKNKLLKAASLKFPFTAGPIPLVLQISAGVTFNPAFTSKNSICKGSLKVTYSGDGGFTEMHGTSTPTGSMAGTAQVSPTTGYLGIGAIGFTIAVEMPRIELELGLNPFGLVPGAYVNTVAAIGVVNGGTTAALITLMPCETHFVDVTGNAGISNRVSDISAFAKFLGLNPKVEASTKLFEQKFTQPGRSGKECPL